MEVKQATSDVIMMIPTVTCRSVHHEEELGQRCCAFALGSTLEGNQVGGEAKGARVMGCSVVDDLGIFHEKKQDEDFRPVVGPSVFWYWGER